MKSDVAEYGIRAAFEAKMARRTNFSSIQAAHVVNAVGYQALPYTTGYDSVIAHRVGDLFAYTAKDEGRVIEVSDKHVTVEYKDGKTKSIELGRRYGTSAGSVYPHTVVTDMKEGQKVKPGEVISYNQEFFTKDLINPGGVVWKGGLLAKTAILDSSDTLEDSCAISTALAERLKTQTVKVRDIVLTFDQSLRNLVKVGETVDVEDILCTIEDAVTADLDLFDGDTIDTLKMLGAQTPRAKMNAVVEKIEVLYNGDKEDMSESLRGIVNASDRQMVKVSRALRKGSINGQVDSSFRVGGNPLVLDTMVVRIYLNGTVAMGVGDLKKSCMTERLCSILFN